MVYGIGVNSNWKFGYIDKAYLPESPGVYLIYVGCFTNRAKIIYIGSTKNLWDRLSQHEIPRCVRAISDGRVHVYVKYKIINDDSKRIKKEYSLIRKIKPKANNRGLRNV
jgi:predicted GIY-YIG superfamily endonuclease